MYVYKFSDCMNLRYSYFIFQLLTIKSRSISIFQTFEFSQIHALHMSHVMRKLILCHMRMTKAQINLRIRAVSVVEQAGLSPT